MLRGILSMGTRTSCALALVLAGAPIAMAQDMAAPAGQAPAESAAAAETWLPSLTTDNAQQGFELALTLARRAVKATQPDVEVLKKERPEYSTDANSLIAVSQTVANWFSVVAAANDYWRN